HGVGAIRALPSFPTRRSSDLTDADPACVLCDHQSKVGDMGTSWMRIPREAQPTYDRAVVSLRDVDRGVGVLADCLEVATLVADRSEEHTSELQSRSDLVCRLL